MWLRARRYLYSSFRAQSLRLVERLAEPYNVVPLESSASPVTWNLSQYCFIFEHNTDANMLCRLFDNRKYMDIYLPIHQEYCYLGKQKIILYFSTSTCYLHLFRLLKCAICRTIPVKFIKFQSQFF